MEVITVASIVAYLAMMFTVGRMRGMDINRNIRLFLFGAVAVLPFLFFLGISFWPYLLVLAVLFAASDIHGHGDWIDFGTNPSTDPGESFNFLFHWIFDMFGWRKDGIFHDSVGLFVSGSFNFVGMAAVLVFYTSTLWPFLLIPAGGVAKSLAYNIGWELYHRKISLTKHIKGGTEWGEGLRGMFFGVIILATAILLV